MMPIAAQILTIIELSLRLALQIAEDMPPEMKHEHWKRVNDGLEFWRKLFDKVNSLNG